MLDNGSQNFSSFVEKSQKASKGIPKQSAKPIALYKKTHKETEFARKASKRVGIPEGNSSDDS